jgi:uncharacterized protein YceH (UPF0502 family)
MPDPATGNAPAWPVLNPLERRVLGVLVEKAKTTPDAYPLSMNALVNGCNQKSNRDPVMDLDEGQVEDTLNALRERGLTMIVTGTRVDRWRHQLYEAWTSDKVELAILTELLLRGPQTEGELRTRVSRMEPIDDIESLRSVLEPLTARKLVVYLTPQGRRGTTLTHGFHSTEELARLKAFHSTGIAAEDVAPPAPPRPPVQPVAAPPAPDAIAKLEARLAEACIEIIQQKNELQALRAEVGQLRELLDKLQRELGVVQ